MRLPNRDEVDDAFWQTTAVECEPDYHLDRGWQLATDVVLHEIENANGTMGKAFPVESPSRVRAPSANHLGSGCVP